MTRTRTLTSSSADADMEQPELSLIPSGNAKWGAVHMAGGGGGR
jgi:hypothetical protein